MWESLSQSISLHSWYGFSWVDNFHQARAIVLVIDINTEKARKVVRMFLAAKTFKPYGN